MSDTNAIPPYFSLAEIAAYEGVSKDTVERKARSGLYGPTTVLGGMVFISRQALADNIARTLAEKDPRRAAVDHWDAVQANDEAEQAADRARQSEHRRWRQSPAGIKDFNANLAAMKERDMHPAEGSRIEEPTKRRRITIFNPVRSDDARRRGPVPVEEPAANVRASELVELERKANPGKPPGARKGFPVNLNELTPVGDPS